MDLGATVCTPKSPDCTACPCADGCRAYAQGLVDVLPQRAEKPTKPTRRGIVYVVRRRDGAWLLERRPNRGLLGGMLAWPTSNWGDEAVDRPPMEGDWTCHNGLIRHTFTHFHLHLRLRTLRVGMDTKPSAGIFVDEAAFRRTDLPTVMRKAFDAARPALMPD